MTVLTIVATLLLVPAAAALVAFSVSRSAVPTTSADEGIMTTMIRTSGDIFASALRDAIGRADEAVSERERTSALLDQCKIHLAAQAEQQLDGQEQLRQAHEELRELREAFVRIEAYFGASAMQEAQQQRGWLQRALSSSKERLGSAIASARSANSQRAISGTVN